MKSLVRNRSVLAAAAAAACICAVLFTHAKTAPRSDRNASPVPAHATRAGADSGAFVPVPLWLHRKFVVLAKQKLFKKFGYELYLSRALGAGTAPLDTSVETPARRIRCDKFAHAILSVSAVEPAGTEYLVSFVQDETGKTIYGKTRKGAIEGIACAGDIDSATRRWVGKTIFSHRGFINTYDTITGSYGKFDVKIQDKLTVTSVSWGLTPIPPQPLWLRVETPAATTGFIPISESWTNVVADQVMPQQPWSEDIFESNPADVFKWDSLMWNAVNRHTIVSGMSKEQVTMSWGRPHSTRADTSRGACSLQWLYGSQYVRFDHDTVVSIGAR
jgi:hypothetical protein